MGFVSYVIAACYTVSFLASQCFEDAFTWLQEAGVPYTTLNSVVYNFDSARVFAPTCTLIFLLLTVVLFALAKFLFL